MFNLLNMLAGATTVPTLPPTVVRPEGTTHVLIKSRIIELLETAVALIAVSGDVELAPQIRLLTDLITPIASGFITFWLTHINKISNIVLQTDISKDEYDKQLSAAIQDLLNSHEQSGTH